MPGFYLVTIVLILFASIVTVRASVGRLRSMAGYADLFFMGAAFLLLETKNVVQFALLFGTTWFVNALVFAGILVSVLAAIEVSRRVTFRSPARLYPALLLALVVGWAVPPDSLLSLAIGPRFVAAVAIAFAPIFLANLVFTQRFKDVSVVRIGFRRQPARSDGRRADRVQRPDRRLSGARRGCRGALRPGLRVRPPLPALTLARRHVMWRTDERGRGGRCSSRPHG